MQPAQLVGLLFPAAPLIDFILLVFDNSFSFSFGHGAFFEISLLFSF